MGKRGTSASPKNKEPKEPTSPSSPPKKAKKAKVDPIADAVAQLQKFFKDADVPKSVKGIVQTSLDPALSVPQPERHPIMTIFAGAIGETLAAAIHAVDAKAKGAEAAAAASGAEEANAQTAAVAADAQLTAAQAAVTAAQERTEAAETHLEASEADLAAHRKEEGTLSKTKAGLDAEHEDLAAALGTAGLKGESPTKKDVQKLVSVLKKCDGSNPSLLQAAPNAVGKTDGFEALVVGEIAKVLSTKKAECEAKLQQWDQHVATLTAGGETKAHAVQAATEQLEARRTELEAAEHSQTTAQAEKKAADKARTAASKAAAQMVNAVNDTAAVVQNCADARAAFDMLFANKGEAVAEA